MSDAEVDSEAEGERQQGGSPLLRKVDKCSRLGRGRSGPSDPMATRDDEDDDTVERGGRGSDAGRDGVSDDDDEQTSGRHSPCLPPVQQQRSSGAMTSRLRSAVSRPVQLQLVGGTRGSGVLRLCRPQQSEQSDAAGENSTPSLV